ncbi:MAG: Cas10/Cmr2 second palm domain-containing protein [Tepidisphaerales bacterium]
MLILGDLSGIQDYLFDVRERGGKQAATLRFRSLRLQLMAEALAERVMRALGLQRSSSLLFCAAGKFAIETGAVRVGREVLDRLRGELSGWLLEEAHGRLRFAMSWEGEGMSADTVDAVSRLDAVQKQLQRWKWRPWGEVWGDGMGELAVYDQEMESERDAALGRAVLERDVAAVSLGGGSGREVMRVAGLPVRLLAGDLSGGGGEVLKLERFARHTPRHADGSLVEFVELAGRSRGGAFLGVLKADADRLGEVFRRVLRGSTGFKPLVELSQRLERFFGPTLQAMLSSDRRLGQMYVVFSGGDDVLMVGPWDVALEFAGRLRGAFAKEFGSVGEGPGLTLSAGCAVVKPRYPVHVAAGQAEELLLKAKSSGRDRFTGLGEVWPWSAHEAVLGAGRKLADWVGSGEVKRGWVHTMLGLTLLRRGEMEATVGGGACPEVATSRLVYHVARNWPGNGAARDWVDGVVREFDRMERTENAAVRYLPAVLRYALLAGRSPGGDEV